MWWAVVRLVARGRAKRAPTTLSSLLQSDVRSTQVPKCRALAISPVSQELLEKQQKLETPDATFPGAQELLRFQNHKLETVDGVQFLRLPQSLCHEWGYCTYRWEPLLLKRDCYDVLNRKIDEFSTESTVDHRARSAVIVLGNSGIGKSAYCLYRLWYLLIGETSTAKNWSMIILKYAQGSGRFFIFTKGRDGKVSVAKEADPRAVLSLAEDVESSNGIVWYLADKQVPTIHWTLRCRFVLTCSPAKENHYHFGKYPVSKPLYVPAWSEKEIMELNNAVFKLSKDDVVGAFKRWGGVPRYVLANRHSDVLLYSAIKSAARQMVRTPAGSDSIVREADYLDAVFHYDVNPATCELHNEFAPMRFASGFVTAGVAKALPASFIDAIAGWNATDKIRSAVFDTFFHRLLDGSLPMISKEMDEHGKWGPTLREELPLMRFEFSPNTAGNDVILPDMLPPSVLDCTLINPESSSNRSWDLIIGRRIVQATVTSRRDTKKLEATAGLVDASNFLKRSYGDGKQLEFIYFVPSKLFDSFSPQLPGGKTATGKYDCMQEFTTALSVKVKKMCLRVDQSPDLEALKAIELLNLSTSSTCSLAKFSAAETFNAMGLRANLLRGMSKCGYKVPRPVQQKVIPAFCAGANVLEEAARGGGCTTALCIGVLQQVDCSWGPFQAVVLAPNEDAAQKILLLMEALKQDSQMKISATSEGGDWHVLVGMPSEAYEVCKNLPKESINSIFIVVLEEADEILMSSSGLQDVRLCLELLPKKRQLGVFATSMPPAVLDFAASEAESLVC